ncbi:MAG: peptidoglycan DD-metalloendopeptidase family protein, partial [Actinomycetota bacterium]|nr:peptidoglycan DD-metalloendopeptidase family protein [Actinomycetota bacterium]
MFLSLAAALAALGVTPTADAWTWPTDGPVLRPFAFGENPYAAGLHRGIDVGGDPATSVRAPASGTVTFAGTVPTGGRSVTIETPDGYSVTLVHLGSTGVLKGAVVSESDTVGTVGPSGEREVDEPYVHLGVRVSAEPEGYVDPLALLPPRRKEPAATEEASGAPAHVVGEERRTPPQTAAADTEAAGQPAEVSVGPALQPPASPPTAVADEPAVETPAGVVVEEPTPAGAIAKSSLPAAGESAEGQPAEAGAAAAAASGSRPAEQPLASAELGPGGRTSAGQPEEETSRSPVASRSSSAGGGAPASGSEPSAAVTAEMTATRPSVTSGEGAAAAPIIASAPSPAAQAGLSSVVSGSRTAPPGSEREGAPLAASPDEVHSPIPEVTSVGPERAPDALPAQESGGAGARPMDADREAVPARRHSVTGNAAEPR